MSEENSGSVKIEEVTTIASGSHKELKMYFDTCEADMKKWPTHYRYQLAFYRIGKNDLDKDVMHIPVEISDGRLSFGKPQFLITPSGVIKGVLGKRWVNRKTLIMQHDRLFEHLGQAMPAVKDKP